jgi:nicotinamidase-related amidase
VVEGSLNINFNERRNDVSRICQHHAHGSEHSVPDSAPRRDLPKTGAAVTAVIATSAVAAARAEASTTDKYADPDKPMLPPSNMKLDLARTALVIIDPQVDFLSPKGVAWGAVGASVTQHDTVKNLSRLFAAAKAAGITVAISPHYYYPTDKGWKFEGALEKLMHKIGMFNRRSPYSTEGFENSGADFMPQFKQYILDDKTIVVSPHKIYGPDHNDLVLQLRKNRIDQVILAGMSANLCVESHLRALLEQGFEVAVVRDATAAAIIPEGDGYLAAITNFRFIANAVWTTGDTVARLNARG